MLFTPQRKPLSVAVNEFSDSVQVNIGVLHAVWNKAEEQLGDDGSIALAPGLSGAFLVKSYSGNRPHIVKVKKSGQYCCDNDCANWRSLGICAHSVAAAEREGKLGLFVKWFKKAKRVTNLTKLATTNMPCGRGRKGGVPPSRRKKKAPYTQRVPFDFTDSTSEDEVSTDMSRGRGHKCGVAPSKRKQKAPPKRKQKAPSKGKQKAPIHFTGNTSEEEVTRGNGKEKAQGALFSTDLSDSEDDIIPTQKASRMYAQQKR